MNLSPVMGGMMGHVQQQFRQRLPLHAIRAVHFDHAIQIRRGQPFTKIDQPLIHLGLHGDQVVKVGVRLWRLAVREAGGAPFKRIDIKKIDGEQVIER